MTRPHHYGFAHRVLRDMLFSDPRKFFAFLGQPEGPGILRRVWMEYGVQLPPDDRLPAEGLDCCAREFNAGVWCPAILVEFPPPEEVAEAHFAVAVIDDVSRYFTLERGLDLAEGTPRTVLCEWRADGTHLNYGDGPEPDGALFLAAVEDKVNA